MQFPKQNSAHAIQPPFHSWIELSAKWIIQAGGKDSNVGA